MGDGILFTHSMLQVVDHFGQQFVADIVTERTDRRAIDSAPRGMETGRANQFT
jgi:hypothetical protein